MNSKTRNALALSSLLLLAAPSFALTAQGSANWLHHFEGANSNDRIGDHIHSAGDANGDGINDLLIAESGGHDKTWIYSGMDGSLLSELDSSPYGSAFNRTRSGKDVNGDGIIDMVRGYPNHDVGNSYSAGKAILLSGADGSLSFDIEGDHAYQRLGESVCIAEDLNGDGYSDLLIGSPGADRNGYQGSGMIQAFSGATGNLLFEVSPHQDQIHFGEVIEAIADVNGDGQPDLAVGSPYTSLNLNRQGALHVLSGANGDLIYSVTGPTEFASLGSAITTVGDWDDDGIDDLAVAASEAENSKGREVGAVFVYSGANGALIRLLEGTRAGNQFGKGIANAGDQNNDGIPDLLVGIPNRGFSGTGLGEIHLYSGLDGAHIWTLQGPNPYDEFGAQILPLGDSNQNGISEFAIGAPEWLLNFHYGSIYILEINSYFQLSAKEVSVITGDSLAIAIDFPKSESHTSYKVLWNYSGSGITNLGIPIPLATDSLLVDSYLGMYPIATTQNMHGILDADGNAQAIANYPAGLPVSLIGQRLFFIAVAGPLGGLPEITSLAASVQFSS